MHAVIRLGNGEWYSSAIFACYSDNADPSSRRHYFIVFDKSKTKLVKQPFFNPAKLPHLDQMVLFYDEDETGWLFDENGYGNVDFLPKSRALQIVADGVIPQDILAKCLAADAQHTFLPSREIRSTEDIEQLMLITGNFHDARIAELEMREDGSLYLLFDGMWGCKTELVLEGDIAYCTDCRDPEIHDPYWSGADMMIIKDYIYFADFPIPDIAELDETYCWFRAKSIKYRIIPL